MLSLYHTLRFWLIITLLSIILGTFSILARIIDPSGNTSHNIARLWGRLICNWNGINVDIHGMENVQQNRAQVFVANHQGYFDIFSLSGYLPVQIRWFAKKSLFKIPFVGWSMSACGYVPVNRENKKQAYEAFLSSIEKLKQGNSIVIFPEGTRSENGLIGPFKKGGHLLATRAKAPMIPVTVIGTGNLIKKGSAKFYPGPIRIIVSPPIEVEEISSRKEEEILTSLRQTICNNYTKWKFEPISSEAD